MIAGTQRWRDSSIVGWFRSPPHLFATLMVVILGWNLVTLMRYPGPFVDEPWNASRAWGMILTGHPFGTLDAGVFERFSDYWTYFPWIGTAIHALAIRLLGLSLFSLRITSFAFGLILLGAIYTIGMELGGQLLGTVATALVSLSNSFVLSSHLGRHDVIVAAVGFTAIAVFLSEKSSPLSARSVLSGLAVGLALDTHPIAIVYPIAIGLLYLFRHKFQIWRVGHFWGFVFGVLIGVTFFIAIHVLPNPQTFFALGKPFASLRAPPLFDPSIEVWRSALWEDVINFAQLISLKTPLVIVALFVSLLGPAPNRTPAILFIALLVSFLAFVRVDTLPYGIILMPTTDLLVAWLLIRTLHPGWRTTPWSPAKGLIVCFLIVASTIFTVINASRDSAPTYYATIQQVSQAVAGNGTVMGSQNYWFAMTDRRYLSWEQLVYFRLFSPGSTLEAAFESLRPDYLILDGETDLVTGEDEAQLPVLVRMLFIRRTELNSFLNHRATQIESFVSGDYGTVRVYRINWQ